MGDTDANVGIFAPAYKKIEDKLVQEDSEDGGIVGDTSDLDEEDSDREDLLTAYEKNRELRPQKNIERHFETVLAAEPTVITELTVPSFNGLADIAEESEETTTMSIGVDDDPTGNRTPATTGAEILEDDSEEGRIGISVPPAQQGDSNNRTTATAPYAVVPVTLPVLLVTTMEDKTETDAVSENLECASPMLDIALEPTRSPAAVGGAGSASVGPISNGGVAGGAAIHVITVNGQLISPDDSVSCNIGVAGDEVGFQEGFNWPPRSSSLQYPDFLLNLESRLQSAYLNQHSPKEHCPWIQFPGKPQLNIHIDPRVRERRHNSILLAPALELDEILISGPSERLILVGPRGAGRSTLLRRLVYQHSLKQLPNLTEFKILVYATSTDLLAGRSLSIYDFLRTQIMRYVDDPDFDVDIVLGWLREHAYLLLLVVDVDSSHASSVCCQPLIDILTGSSSFYIASVVISLPMLALPDVLDQLSNPPKVFDMVPWTDDDILKFLREFAGIFDEDDMRTEFLEFIENLDCCKLLQTADNCALTCLLYFLDPNILCEKNILSRTDLLDLLFIHVIRQHFPPPCHLANAVLPFTEKCWELVSAGQAEGFVLKIPVSTGEVALSSREFTEFLAAKYVALRYFHALLADQVGGSSQLEDSLQLFRDCWNLDDTSYQLGRICIYLSCLLRSDYHQFLDILSGIFPEMSQMGKRECLRVCGECTQENQACRGFVSKLKAAIELSLGTDISAERDGDLFPSLPDGLDARNLSSLKLNEATLTNDEAVQHLPSCLHKAGKLRELEIDFTPLDPSLTQRVAFSPNELDYDPLRDVVTTIKMNRALQRFSFSLKLDIMSIEAIEIISSLFLEASLNNLTQLSANIQFRPSSSHVKGNDAISEAVEIFISRFNDFLERNTSLLSLELSSGFLQHDLLTVIQAAIIDHAHLTTLSINSSGNPESAAVIHPYASSVLADLIRCRDWLDLSFDLTGFLPTCKRSISMGYLSSRVAGAGGASSCARGGTARSNSRRPGGGGSGLISQNGGGSSSSTLNETKISDDVDLLQSQVIRALQNHNTVRRISLQTRTFQPNLLDFLSDLIERCQQLSRLELSTEVVDDVLLLAIGCGVVCATQLESLIISGSFVGVVNGGSLPGLFQSCSMSPRLREIQIKANPLSVRCLDSLVISLPDIPLFPTECLNVILDGHVLCRDVKTLQKKLDKLRKHEFHQNFKLDVKLSPLKKASDT